MWCSKPRAAATGGTNSWPDAISVRLPTVASPIRDPKLPRERVLVDIPNLGHDDRVALQELKARYFRFVDTKDWVGFETLFAPDATLAAVDDLPGVVFKGASGVREGVAGSMHDVVSVHHGFTPELHMVAPDEAAGIWPMEDLLWFGEASSAPGLFLHGFGHYHERYVRVSGEWLFRSIRLHRMRVETRNAVP